MNKKIIRIMSFMLICLVSFFAKNSNLYAAKDYEYSVVRGSSLETFEVLRYKENDILNLFKLNASKSNINELYNNSTWTFALMTAKKSSGGNVLDEVMKCEKGAMLNMSFVIGIAMLLIKIAVPIILIVMISIDLLQSITKDDGAVDMKKITRRIVAAVAVFLAPTIVSLLMKILGGTDYKACYKCVEGPFTKECKSEYKKNLQ